MELGLRTLGSCDYCWPKDTGLGRRKLRPLGVRRSSLFQRVLSVQFLTIREAPPVTLTASLREEADPAACPKPDLRPPETRKTYCPCPAGADWISFQ